MHEPRTLLGREVEPIVPELVEDEVGKPLGVFEIRSVERSGQSRPRSSSAGSRNNRILSRKECI